ncbi:MAG: DNRLRE domain-containing protein [Nonlabens sp.]
MKKILLSILVLTAGIIYAQTTVTLNPVKDNSIFSESSNSNGQGSLFSGAISNGNSRRALITFDLGVIPAGATISDVSLEFTITRSRASNTPYTLHVITSDWGEGASAASGQGGQGATAQAPDATWQDAMLGTASWTTPGGDFVATESATTNLTNGDSNAIFTSTGLASDVQNWLDGTTSNFGWILIGDESGSRNAVRFDSREDTNPPLLTVTYTTTASVQDQTLSDKISVGPNPTSDYFKISIDQNVLPMELYIYDVLGNKVFDAKRPAASIYNFNANLPSGIYILKINQGNETATRKLIVR